ncbi:hypothetical protein [Mesorhizobium sp.]|jgi:hypothetical protein|uniref:hypothetical protein n=2 Tax=Mesorhizobium sp. TaxID=1871066 RepID=UPI00257BE98B|nr:hypothetical protein [Mesorhizobium sp.]
MLEGRSMLDESRSVGREELLMSHTFHTVTVEGAAEAYVLSRGKARYLSIAQAIRAIRTLMPACKATNHELEEMLAAACVVHGVPVAFDAKTADSPEPRLHS